METATLIGGDVSASRILGIPEVREVVHRISVDQYHRFCQVGAVPERTELLRGIIVDKMTVSPLHSLLCQYLDDLLDAGIEQGWHVRMQQPLTLANSEPEPDLAVVQGGLRDYGESHPATAALVVEVAISSVELDRAKADIYAEAGIPEYWIVLGEQQIIEVRQSPKNGRYERLDQLKRGATLKPRIFPAVSVDLEDLFTA